MYRLCGVGEEHGLWKLSSWFVDEELSEATVSFFSRHHMVLSLLSSCCYTNILYILSYALKEPMRFFIIIHKIMNITF